jgi:hypothetical protein
VAPLHPLNPGLAGAPCNQNSFAGNLVSPSSYRLELEAALDQEVPTT